MSAPGSADQDDAVTDEATTDEAEADGAGSGPTAAFREDPDCFDLDVAEPSTEGSGSLTCGYVETPLDHDDPDGPRIELAVVVYEGRSGGEFDRPLVVLGGGPGEVMVENFLAEPLFRDAFDVGPDLIVVDQRGVGSSIPALECPEAVEDLDQGTSPQAGADAQLEDLLGCRERLADDGVDLGAFNHLANAADVEVIRRALGHEQIDLRGISYGTQVALLATQMQPDTVHAVILSSPVDPTRNWVELAPAGVQRALDRVADACEADRGCAEAFGDVRALIEDTVERLAVDPEEVTVELPEREAVTLTFTPARFLGGLSLLFYLPDGAGALPALSAAAADGELGPIAELTAAVEEQIVGALSVGMQFSMLCTGEGALVTPASLRDATDPGPIEEHWLPENLVAGDGMSEVCDGWDVETVYDPAEVVLDHDVPSLIVTGEFDHVTPAELGETVHTRLSESVLIEVPAAGHAPLEALGPCGEQIIGAFLRDPTMPPEATCATQRALAFAGALGPDAS